MLAFSSSQAQQIAGVYRMTGGHEMVAAFQFKKDSSFEFYFIYGAVDRKSSGHFTVHDRIIVLHADKVPGRDFTIVRQEKRGDENLYKNFQSQIPHWFETWWAYLKKEPRKTINTVMIRGIYIQI